jgi:RNA recognition motif-containing protein
LTNRDLAEFLAPCGKIREAKIVMAKGRSKGVAYVEFYSDESVPKAIGMTGHKLLGIPIICSASEAYKNAEVEQRDIANGINPRERVERYKFPFTVESHRL